MICGFLLELSTDASGVGFAGLLKGQWFQGHWPSFWSDLNIAIKELFPIVLALHLWPSVLRDRRLIVFCDNEAVVHVINNQMSKDKKCMSLIHTMTVLLMQNNVILRAKHVPCKTNIIAAHCLVFKTHHHCACSWLRHVNPRRWWVWRPACGDERCLSAIERTDEYLALFDKKLEEKQGYIQRKVWSQQPNYTTAAYYFF